MLLWPQKTHSKLKMITNEIFRQIALGLPGATEQPHFEKTSFRIGKKIFATLNEKHNRACIKLNEIDQNVFSAVSHSAIYPVPNKWGKQGWTNIDLETVDPELLEDAIQTSFNTVVNSIK